MRGISGVCVDDPVGLSDVPGQEIGQENRAMRIEQ